MDTIANVWPADNSGVSSHGPAARNRHATPWLAAPRQHLRSARRAAGGAFACRAAANNASAPSRRRLSSPPASGGGAAAALPRPPPCRCLSRGSWNCQWATASHAAQRCFRCSGGCGRLVASLRARRRQRCTAGGRRRPGAAISAAARLPMPCPYPPPTLRAPPRRRPGPEKINRFWCELCCARFWKMYPMNASHYTVL